MNQIDPTSRKTDGADVPEGTPKRRPRSLAGRLVRGIGIGLLGLVGLLLLVVGLLQTPWGARQVVRIVTGLDLFDGAHLQIGGAGGTFLTHLTLTDVALVTDEGAVLARIDTAAARYNLLPLLRGELHLADVALAGLEVTLTQRPDSSWDLLALFADTAAAPAEPDTAGGFAVYLDRLRLRDGRVAARFFTPHGDSTYRVRDLDLALHGLHTAPTFAIFLDSLRATVEPPGAPEPVSMALAASFAGGRLALDRLRLASPYSDVTGHGVLLLPEDTTALRDVDFTLDAHPLAFRDIRLFVPSLDPDGTLDATVRARGTDSLLDASIAIHLSDGGTLDLKGALSPTGGGPSAPYQVYRLDGTIRGVNPALFVTGTPALDGQVNADVRVDLEGPALDRLNGRFALGLVATRLGAYALDSTQAAGTFTDGRAQLTFSTGARGTALTLDGSLRPFDAEPTYDLDARVAGFDLGRFADSTQSSNLTAALALSGRGFAPETAALEGGLTLEPSTFNEYRIEAGTVDARLAGGRLTLATELRFPQGLIAADAELDTGPALAYRLTNGRFENVDVAALIGAEVESRLAGTFTAEGAGTDSAALTLDADVRLGPSFYGPYALHEAVLTLHLEDGAVDADLTGHLDGGSVRLAASARPFDAVPTYAVRRGAFFEVDLGRLLPESGQTSELNGTLTLEGRGFDPAAMALDARVALSESQLNRQFIRQAGLAVSLQDGTLDARFDLDLPEGASRIDLRARPLDDVPVYTIREGTLAGLNVGALIGQPGTETNLNGRIAGDVQGLEPETMRLDARIDLSGSTLNGETLHEGTVEATLDQGAAQLTSTLRLGRGSARLRAGGTPFADVPRYEAAGTLTDLSLADLMGNDSLEARVTLDFDVAGTGFAPDSLELRGRAHGTARVDAVRVDTIATAFNVAGGLLDVDTLLVRSNVATLTGGGQIALYDTLGVYASEFLAELVTADLGPLAPLAGAGILDIGSGRLSARIYGRPGRLQFDTQIEVEQLLYDDIRLAAYETRILGHLTPERTLSLAEARGTVDALSLPTMLVDNIRYEADYNAAEQAVQFLTTARVDDRRNARLEGTVDLTPDNRQILLDDLRLNLDEDHWELLMPASISIGNNYRVRNFLLFADDQQIAVDGVVDFQGEQSLVLTIEGFRTASVADLLNFQGLGGTINGSLDLSGPATAPRIDGFMNLDILLNREPVGDLNLTLAYDSLQLNVDARFTHADASTMRIYGVLPMDLALAAPDAAGARGLRMQEPARRREVDLTIAADAFSIDWVLPFLDPTVIDRIEGQLAADVTLQGSLDDPQLEGTATLRDGRLRMPILGVNYTDVEADVQLAESRVLIEEMRARTGDGRLSANGSIHLAQFTLGEFDMNFQARRAVAANTREYRIVTSADLELSGTTDAPVLDGSVQMDEMDYYLDTESSGTILEEATFTEADIADLERNFGIRVTEADTTTFDFYAALAMDIDVTMERNTWIRSRKNPEMNIQFTGELDVQKDPYGSEQIFGTIEVVPERSYINQFGKRFDITQGTLNFNGPVESTRMDVEAAYEVPSRRSQENEVVITLGIEGTLDNLDVTPGSEPQMELTDILSYIATGRPANQALQLGGAGAGLAVNQGFQMLEGFVQSSGLGLDVVQIEPSEDLKGATVTAGKYVTRRLYTSVSQPVGTAGDNTSESQLGTTITLEYEIFDRLLLTLTGGETVMRFNLRWQYAY